MTEKDIIKTYAYVKAQIEGTCDKLSLSQEKFLRTVEEGFTKENPPSSYWQLFINEVEHLLGALDNKEVKKVCGYSLVEALTKVHTKVFAVETYKRFCEDLDFLLEQLRYRYNNTKKFERKYGINNKYIKTCVKSLTEELQTFNKKIYALIKGLVIKRNWYDKGGFLGNVEDCITELSLYGENLMLRFYGNRLTFDYS